jgi:hypothetical protein
LEKDEKRFPIRDDGLEGPAGKPIMLMENLDEACVEHCRDTLLAVMATQQDAEQIGRFADEFRCDLEDMPQHELFGRIITQHAGCMPLLGFKERIELPTVQSGDHRVAQSGEDLPEATARNRGR